MSVVVKQQAASSKSGTGGVTVASDFLATLLGFFDRFFDWLYTSQYNPLYRSGTLATGLLTFVVATGFYLLFFYKLSAPFESIRAIQAGFWLHGLVRSVHRYASDAAVVAVAFHALRMVAEKKTWGPRLLAWTSGVIMMGVLFLSGWTGYVLVWDRQGQILAAAGARMADSLHLFSEPLLRSFGGVAPVLSSFFFMNLFLHVALPLGMIGGLWLHTSRLARSVWFPPRETLWVSLIGIIALSLVVPAPLASAPDLLRVYGREPLDWFFNFWLPLDWHFAPGTVLALTLGTFAVVFSMFAWWKPRTEGLPMKSQNDPLRCTGCGQCAIDCPFEAIEMVPRTEGTGSETVSMVSPELCVACGLCSGSCSQLAIGPPDRFGKVQVERIRALRSGVSAKTTQDLVAVVWCRGSFTGSEVKAIARKADVDVALLDFDCLGSIHPASIQLLQGSFARVFALGCPETLCQTREGVGLFRARMIEGREPADKVKIDPSRFALAMGTRAEKGRLAAELKEFARGLRTSRARKAIFWLKTVAATGAILACIALLSQVVAGFTPTDSFLRLSWRVPRQTIEHCRVLSEEELARRPVHMRKPKECSLETIPYRLRIKLDGAELLSSEVLPQGARGDRPMFVEELRAIPPGDHHVVVEFTPKEESPLTATALKLRHEFSESFAAGRAIALGWESVGGIFRKK